VHRGKEHWLAALAARVSGTRRPIVRTRHIAQSVRSHAGNRWLYGRATDLVVTVTDAIRRQMIAGGVVTGDRVVTLAGGVDADRYSPGPRDPEVYRRLGGRDDAILVGMVAGFRLMKGHTVVVDAAARLRARGVNAQFVFVGQGPFEARTRAAITALHLDDRFTLGGFADDLPAVMRALDVALYVPLESEGMSRVLFEVLASGRAVIASRVGIAPERLVDDDHALLVAAGDAAPLADALMRIVNDPGLRQRLGGAARRLVETDCSGARVAAVLETHYEQLARRSTRRAA
jgi:glycosyltransferase involved in cell wall biosynthesis